MRIPASLATFALFVVCCFSVPLSARADTPSAETAWRLLDYLSVDYGGAVADGRVVSPSEYAEMVEFAGQVQTHLTALPANPVQPSLIRQAEALKSAIERKAPKSQVAGLAKTLGKDLLAAYPVPLAPLKAPDLARGAALYQQQCAACHGVLGAGDGEIAKGL